MRMAEPEFWGELELRVNRELAMMPEDSRRAIWCDRLLPKRFDVNGASPSIAGEALVRSESGKHESWNFVLALPNAVPSRDAIPWGELLPEEAAAGWVTADATDRKILLAPASAVVPRLDEEQFWILLEGDLTCELARSGQKPQSAMWCDGFIPSLFELDQQPPRIKGSVFLGATGQEEWTFTFWLPSSIRERNAIDWSQLLPLSAATDWFRLDVDARTLDIGLPRPPEPA